MAGKGEESKSLTRWWPKSRFEQDFLIFKILIIGLICALATITGIGIIGLVLQ